MHEAWSDLRYGLRRLAASPGFTAVATITLALGIGANAAIYSVVDALVLRSLPYRDPSNLLQVWSMQSGGSMVPSLLSDALAEWRAHTEVFARLEPYAYRPGTLTGDGEPEIVPGAEIGGGVMDVLGVVPALGRGIQPQDAEAGRDRVVVLSDRLWRRRFGADARIIGQRLRLDERTYDVVGVMPPSFRFPYEAHQFWLPLVVTPPEAGGRVTRVGAIARLRPGVTTEQAQSRLEAIGRELDRTRPTRTGWQIRLRPFLQQRVNLDVRRALFVLLGAVAFLLLIACANLATLFLLQGVARKREIAVRAALGAGRVRLVRQLLSEAFPLAGAGGVVGVGFALGGIRLLAALAPSDLTFFSVNEIALDARVLTFTLGLTIGTVVLFGLLPALRGSHTALHEALEVNARGAVGSARHRHLHGTFVVIQLALSLILLVGAGLLTRTFVRLTRVDPGFNTTNLVAIDLSLPRWKYPTRNAQEQFVDQLVNRLRATPGVQTATVTGGIPPTGGGFSFGLAFEIDGRGVVLDDPSVWLPFTEVAPEFFQTMGIPLKAGRAFSRDDGPDAPKVIIVSQTMARRLWPEGRALGSRLRLYEGGAWYTVVGVAGDVFQLDHARPRGLFAAYYPLSQGRGIPVQQTLVVRTLGDPGSLLGALKAQIWALDPEQPISKLATARELYAEFFAAPRFYAWLMGLFAFLGVVMATVGLYGVLAAAMAQRTREFAVRLALGARGLDVQRLALVYAVALTATGVAVGTAGSFVATHALESLLVDVSPGDPLTYGVVVLVLALVGLAACWVPARRAGRVDPLTVLRSE